MDITLIYGGEYDLYVETINVHDFNKTDSKNGSICVADDGTFTLEVKWDYGSVHSTYKNTTCSGSGTLNNEEGMFMSNKIVYSNSPYEIWSGEINIWCEGLAVLHGRYDWFGWDRTSNGVLLLKISLTDTRRAVTTRNKMLQKLKAENKHLTEQLNL